MDLCGYFFIVGLETQFLSAMKNLRRSICGREID
jgi:hypothetical protein